MVLIDPIVAHISGSIDSHRDHQVRRALSPVARLAHETGAAVVGIDHLNKSPGGNVLSRLGGSVAFGAAARSVLLCQGSRRRRGQSVPGVDLWQEQFGTRTRGPQVRDRGAPDTGTDQPDADQGRHAPMIGCHPACPHIEWYIFEPAGATRAHYVAHNCRELARLTPAESKPCSSKRSPTRPSRSRSATATTP